MMALLCVLVAIAALGAWWPQIAVIRALYYPDRVPTVAPTPPPLVHHFDVPDDDLLADTRVLTAFWDTHDVSGEFKRHQVLSALIDRHPQRSKREMARAIEVAVVGSAT